ncbi:aspartate dehydrogenase [Leucobacter exalbidus]|uniref:Aspartate dehydrogenase n=1 Tax=Leucobacter exalbidus TaxID=662960 RepID=A0A940T2L4_9MICO|nr:aspartate dehydrogenase domain-containing protein [Leucobacter exalbidus]MBP1324918.1 aspartate dehydrogenase [Leucobacter exalbidus]
MSADVITRVTVLGYGAIGSAVADELAAGGVPGAQLMGVVMRDPDRAIASPHRVLSLDAAIAHSDLIVECATGAALRAAGPKIIAAGVSLLPASLGALADASLRYTLLRDGPGRCYLTAGAIGGLDLLGAAARSGGLTHVSLTSTKLARTLVQPWMTAAEGEQLRTTQTPIELFDGTVHEAISRFPASLNVGVALAAATDMWDAVRVRLVADPGAQLTHHRIQATGTAGDYDFSITNKPLAQTPTSSGVVPAALLRGIAHIARPTAVFV